MKGSTGIIFTQGGDAWATATAVDGSGHNQTPVQSTSSTTHHSSNSQQSKPTIGEKMAGLGNEIIGKLTHNAALEEHGKHLKLGDGKRNAETVPQSDLIDTAL